MFNKKKDFLFINIFWRWLKYNIYKNIILLFISIVFFILVIILINDVFRDYYNLDIIFNIVLLRLGFFIILKIKDEIFNVLFF